MKRKCILTMFLLSVSIGITGCGETSSSTQEATETESEAESETESETETETETEWIIEFTETLSFEMFTDLADQVNVMTLEECLEYVSKSDVECDIENNTSYSQINIPSDENGFELSIRFEAINHEESTYDYKLSLLSYSNGIYKIYADYNSHSEEVKYYTSDVNRTPRSVEAGSPDELISYIKDEIVITLVEADTETEAEVQTETEEETYSPEFQAALEQARQNSKYSLQYGDVVSIQENTINERNVLIIEAKITSSYSNEATVSQNYYNVVDLIQNQYCSKYDEIQYWAVADMSDGSEAKVVSFTISSSLIQKIKNEEVVANQLGNYVDDLYIHSSLRD